MPIVVNNLKAINIISNKNKMKLKHLKQKPYAKRKQQQQQTYFYWNSVKGTWDKDGVITPGCICSSSSTPAIFILIVCSSRPDSFRLNKSYFFSTAIIGINIPDARMRIKHSASPQPGYGVFFCTAYCKENYHHR